MFAKVVKTIQKTNAARNPRNIKTDYIKDAIADRMADRFLDIKRDFRKVLDFGAGSGHVIKFMDKETIPGVLIQFDSSSELLFRDEQIDYEVATERVVGDMEHIPFKENDFDAVVSCLALHWINDLPGILSQLQRVLKADGVFMGSIMGGDSLYELRTSLQLAETERCGGISPHISPMVRHQDMGSLLSRAGFTLTTGSLM
jgi:NADH dehydrogenase [ubiquinone] 1 alpha subcomplex assembly factor 5